MREADLIDRDIEGYLALQQKKEILRFLTAGSVDDGKSTLIGRLLYDSSALYDDHLDALRRDSAKKSSAGGEIDYSLLVDGLLSEREQGITIDVAYRYFATEKRKFIIADTPGHEQYTRNMATGASTADLAIVLIDARYGVLPQTRRHSTIAHLLGIRNIVVAVNKMDLCGYDRAVFDRIVADYGAFAEQLGIAHVKYIPLSALKGDNIVEKSVHMPWYEGPALLEHLETVPLEHMESGSELRFPVQYVIRPNLDFRGFAGTVVSGVLRKGDRIMSLPSRRTSTVERIVTFDGDIEAAFAPMAVTVTLADEIDVSRGDMLVHEGALPHVGRSIEATVVWMNERPMKVGASYWIKHGTQLVFAEVDQIHDRLDVTTLERKPTEQLALNDIGRVTLTAARPLLFDTYRDNRATGAFILIDRLSNGTFGAGMVAAPGTPKRPLASSDGDRGVLPEERVRRLGHRPFTVVLVGDPAKAQALALALERRLWDEGLTVCRLPTWNPDSVALCHDLGLVTLSCVPDLLESLPASIAREQIFVADVDAVSIDLLLEQVRRASVVR